MQRWVNRGAKGIALIDDTGPRRTLRYVFDVSDTHMVRGGKTPYLWKLKEDQQEMLLRHLTDTYRLDEETVSDLPSALRTIAGEMAADSLKKQWTAWNMPFPVRFWRDWMRIRSGWSSVPYWQTVPFIPWHGGVD